MLDRYVMMGLLLVVTPVGAAVAELVSVAPVAALPTSHVIVALTGSIADTVAFAGIPVPVIG